jgi:predicted unusual protein kinase regulating ubiquinone biosynthesis (AarF/ABC1/UbiB family)
MNLLKPFVIGLEYQVSKNTKLLKRRLEAAGPTYIKMGQFVSNRPDIFGKALSNELATLQDSVTPTPSEKVPPPGITDFDPVPFASASIAQVHRAKYNGKQVAVKIKRPEVDQRLRKDLSGFKLLMRDDPKFMVDFENSLIKELDFKQEVRNAQAFARMYYFDRTVIVPTVYPEVCTDDMIVMDYVESGPGTPKAERLINMFLEQLLFEDMIHGDMHSGNIGLVDSSLILYDFGNVIRTTKEYRDATREFVWHLQSRDIPKIIQTMRKMGMYVSNEKATKAFIHKLLRYLDSMDIAEFRFTADEIQERVPVVLDPTTSAIVRSFSLLEGYCKSVDPGFSYQRILEQNLEMLFSDLGYLFHRLGNP